MTARAELIAAAFKWACLAELDAPKPGNVHAFAGGHGMAAGQFIASAEAAAPPLSADGARIGARILGAVEATFAAVGANTNLGIILLCAPLAAAAEARARDFRAALVNVLSASMSKTPTLRFTPLRGPRRPGLDGARATTCSKSATVGLLQAMQQASDRDRIARQYATHFADVFDVGLAAFETGTRQYAGQQWATLATFSWFSCSVPGHPHFAQVRFGHRRGSPAKGSGVSVLATGDRPAHRTSSGTFGVGCGVKSRWRESGNQC